MTTRNTTSQSVNKAMKAVEQLVQRADIEDEILQIVRAEMQYWQKQDCTENSVLAGIQIGAMGACSNVIAAIASGEWTSTQVAGVDSVSLKNRPQNETSEDMK